MEKDYSIDALGRFLDHAADKGLIKKNTAKSRKTAAFKILYVLDEHEKQDLRNIDVEHTFERFSNLQGMEFKPASLQVFKSRLRSALTDFFAYMDNPATFKPSGVQRNNGPSRKNNGRNNNQSEKRETSESSRQTMEQPREQIASNHLVIPIPLREGLTVKIHNIPADLSKQESEKIAAIIRAYAMPDS